MKKGLFKMAAVFVLALAVVVGGMRLSLSAAVTMTDDEFDTYDMEVGDYPSDFGGVYAKFNTNRNDVESFLLDLVDDDETTDNLIAALGRQGYNVEDDYIMIPMWPILYEYYEDEDDYFETASSIDTTVLFEMPSDFEGIEDKVKVFILKGTSLSPVNYTLVEYGDYYYMQFKLNSQDDGIAVMGSLKDIEDYENSLEEGDGDDGEEPTAAPTKAPTAAPTKAPTAAPTKAPSSNTGKDKVPQTGDGFSIARTLVTILLSGTALFGIIWFFKKK